MHRPHRFLAIGATALILLLSACGGTGSSASGNLTHLRLQLQWVPQAQFAGYFAAVQQNYYRDEGLDIELVPGGPDVAPQVEGSKPNGPEFAISWTPKVLQARESEAGSDLVNIAQIFQRAGTLSVSWKDSNITSPSDFAGKKVGAWGFGNELEVIASARLAGLTENEDFTAVTQPFDMTLLLNAHDGCAASDTDCVDVAEAMIYNEYAQLLETKNPDTGELYKPEDLNVIDYNEVGTAMLQDGLWARAAWLAEAGHEDLAVGFLRASFKGWMYCRDHPDDCVKYVTDAGSTLGAGHQKWMMNEINALIWPAPKGIGVMDKAAFDRTARIAKQFKVIKKTPSGAYRDDLAKAAVAQLKGQGVDVNGRKWKKAVVKVTPGGK